jgi:polysaccharide biosynthesis protein PslG
VSTQASGPFLLLVAMALLGSTVVRAAEDHQGLQGGWAVDDQGNVNFLSSFSLHNPIMHEAEAGWVRVNFRLGRCFRDWTSVGCNGRTALEVYDEVVDIAQTNRFRVLGLVSNEAWHGAQERWLANNAEAARGDGDNPYIRGFARHAVAVLAGYFSDRVGHWEIWNEPNAWTYLDDRGRPAGGSFVYPSNFAWILRRAYEEIKLAHPGATVISGGLFGHELGGVTVPLARSPCPTRLTSGADYLCATYEMGLGYAGWQAGAYPFDHAGQHLYVDIGGATSEEKLRTFLQDVRDAYLEYEGPDTPKMTYITEFGWTTTQVTPEVQAANLLTAYDTFRRVEYVARAYWFHAQDVPEADLHYGLVDGAGRKKRSFVVYQDAAAYDSPFSDAAAPRPTPRGRG